MSKYAVLLVYTAYLVLQIFTSLVAAIHGKKGKTNENRYIQNMCRFHMFYFTIWGYGFQLLFVLTAILDEISQIVSADITIQKQLGRFRAFMFNTFVFPCSIFILSLFWIFWYIDRELVFPKVIDSVLPSWINYSLHALIIIPIITEVLLPKKYSFVTFSNAAKTLTGVLVFYQFTYFCLYFWYGVWLYPIYGIISWPIRILFTLGQFCIVFTYLKIGIELQNRKKVNIRLKVK